MSDQYDFGLIGLAVMGQNLVLNMEDHGYGVAVFNRTVSKVDDFIAANPGKKLFGASPSRSSVPISSGRGK